MDDVERSNDISGNEDDACASGLDESISGDDSPRVQLMGRGGLLSRRLDATGGDASVDIDDEVSGDVVRRFFCGHL